MFNKRPNTRFRGDVSMWPSKKIPKNDACSVKTNKNPRFAEFLKLNTPTWQTFSENRSVSFFHRHRHSPPARAASSSSQRKRSASVRAASGPSGQGREVVPGRPGLKNDARKNRRTMWFMHLFYISWHAPIFASACLDLCLFLLALDLLNTSRW